MKVGSGIKAILGEYITDKRVVEECEGKVVGHIDSLLRIKEREILEEMRVRCVEAISKMSEGEIEALGYVKIGALGDVKKEALGDVKKEDAGK